MKLIKLLPIFILLPIFNCYSQTNWIFEPANRWLKTSSSLMLTADVNRNYTSIDGSPSLTLGGYAPILNLIADEALGGSGVAGTINFWGKTNKNFSISYEDGGLVFNYNNGTYDRTNGYPINNTIGGQLLTLTPDGKIVIGYDGGNTKFNVYGDINFTGNLFKNGQLLSHWGSNGTNSYYNLGNVGIGTTTPTQSLTVKPTTDMDAISWQRSIDGHEVGRLGVTGGTGSARYGWIGLWNAAGSQTVQIDAGGGNSFINSGNLGIGTATPTQSLTVKPNTDIDAISWQRSIDGHEVGRLGVTGGAGTARYGWIGLWNATGSVTVQIDAGGGNSFINSGNFGIGTTDPKTLLNVNLGAGGSNSKAGIRIGGLNNYESLELGIDGDYDGMIRSYGNNINYYAGHWKTKGTTATENHSHNWYTSKAGSTDWSTVKMTLNQDGNLLIGKTTQKNTIYKLDVNGSVRANEVIVNTDGSDFVFDPNYKLRTLKEVETFIKQNKHLPEIAPAAEMQANGVGLADLQTKLLQKLEEMTLYVIEQNKDNQALKQQVEMLKLEVDTLIKKMSK